MRLFNGMKLGTGLLIGAATVVVAPIVIPMVAAAMRPLAKAAVKGGLMAYEKGKVIVAEAQENLEDLMAETKAEMASESEDANAAPKKKPVAIGAKGGK
jgi:hypothetical protein